MFFSFRQHPFIFTVVYVYISFCTQKYVYKHLFLLILFDMIRAFRVSFKYVTPKKYFFEK